MAGSRSPVSVRGGAGRTDAGLAAHILRVETATVDLGPRAAVQNRKQPNAGECDRDREQCRVVERDRRRPLGVAERYLPYGRRQDDADDIANQAEEAADQRTPRGKPP